MRSGTRKKEGAGSKEGGNYENRENHSSLQAGTRGIGDLCIGDNAEGADLLRSGREKKSDKPPDRRPQTERKGCPKYKTKIINI